MSDRETRDTGEIPASAKLLHSACTALDDLAQRVETLDAALAGIGARIDEMERSLDSDARRMSVDQLSAVATEYARFRRAFMPRMIEIRARLRYLQRVAPAEIHELIETIIALTSAEG